MHRDSSVGSVCQNVVDSRQDVLLTSALGTLCIWHSLQGRALRMPCMQAPNGRLFPDLDAAR